MNSTQPLGTQFKSHELNSAINSYLLDPYQYKITKFNYSITGSDSVKSNFGQTGLEFKDSDFDKLLPEYTSVKKSVKDIPALSYHQFLSNDGYFNPNESTDNSDLWYYGADKLANENNGRSGPVVNLQETNHIIFPEAQRGGLGTKNLVKYSSANNFRNINNMNGIQDSNNCTNFNWNTKDNAQNTFDSVYKYDSTYIRNIGISGLSSGSMPE